MKCWVTPSLGRLKNVEFPNYLSQICFYFRSIFLSLFFSLSAAQLECTLEHLPSTKYSPFEFLAFDHSKDGEKKKHEEIRSRVVCKRRAHVQRLLERFSNVQKRNENARADVLTEFSSIARWGGREPFPENGSALKERKENSHVHTHAIAQ